MRRTMAFSDYKNISQTQKEFGIAYREERFLFAEPVLPPEAFLRDLEFSRANMDIFTSEASRTELVISPLLREAYKRFYERYAFWIQKPLNYSEKLSGIPDYLIATKSALGKTVLETPLVVVVEAKKNDFEQGWGQCLAELIAAQKLNDNPSLPVFGIVTDGELWKFGKLIGTEFVLETTSYTLTDLPELFGVLLHILETAD
ncbi:hypothetical protein [Armatimonas sp.]|uniref:hypothetical protein n=1 Tax=Armatimonas sp. TaxID=1872638 RepID=UPI00374DE83A